MNNRWKAIGFLLLCTRYAFFGQGAHPRLMLTREDARSMKAALGTYPLLDTSFQRAKMIVDVALTRPAEVPRPLDAGGPAHQRHKENYTEMQLAGILYAVTGDEQYARFVRDILMKYVELWPTLPKHPKAAGESYGRLFWQSLNETVWLVHVAQAYDCIVEWLTPEDRGAIESKLLRPMADYFITEHLDEFDRIHNHGTWTVAAVGMTGYALGDRDLVDKALLGSGKDGKGGFLRQLDLLFSPDGFYTEGPYYVRYAIMPFIVFAQVIENNDPSRKIFSYRDQILRRAFYAAMQQTYTNGAFIPFNDAMKEKNFLSPEIIIALDVVYDQYGGDRGLLWVAQQHGEVLLNGAGLKVARDLAGTKRIETFPYASVTYADGGDGSEGGIGILRYGPVTDQSLLLMKYTGHGLSHGHYDKLGILYYDQGREILQDYGAARFINVEPKYGGRYLPETKTWTRQTIAHNTVTVDGVSHFEGKESVSEGKHGNLHYFDGGAKDVQVISATVEEANPGVTMQRTAALVHDPIFANPLVIDIIRVTGKSEHQYDLPYYYLGHLIHTNAEYTPHSASRAPLGGKNGYEHLWVEAEAAADGPVSLSWLNGNRYYTLTSAGAKGTRVFYTRIGANDPNFNLRPEPGILFRRKASSTTFATILEPHGVFDPVKEFSVGARPVFTSVSVVASNEEATIVELSNDGGLRWTFMTTNMDSAPSAEHTIDTQKGTYRWTGDYHLIKHAK